MEIRRRGFIAGLGALAGLMAAPAIIRTPGLLMPVKPQIILPGNFELDGYKLNSEMSYQWITTHVLGVPEKNFLIPPGSWESVHAMEVGAETAFLGQQLVQRPKLVQKAAMEQRRQEAIRQHEMALGRAIRGFEDNLPKGFRSLGYHYERI